MPMTAKTIRRLCLMLLALCLAGAACQTVPVTGRRQLSLVAPRELHELSFSSYREFLDQNKVVKNTPEARMVQKVGADIRQAVERYFAANSQASHLAGYAWEFNTVEDEAANAWCMPGGKVVVYTGILPFTRDENGLAVVIGHEVAHAVANHGSERLSQQLLMQMGGTALAVAVKSQPQATQNLFMAAFGLGAQVGIMLPYSRLHEAEADRLGLIFMAMAGYDPRLAVDFWQRMAAEKQGSAPPELLSTHPSDQTRIAGIRQYLPEALAYYKK
jgi:predicted Zn-dependent protease